MITTEECLELAGRLGIASTYGSPTCLDFTDSRFVLLEAMKMDDWEAFKDYICYKITKRYYFHDIDEFCEVMVDTTGKLAKLLLEYLRRKE